jgi:hypothetical protein
VTTEATATADAGNTTTTAAPAATTDSNTATAAATEAGTVLTAQQPAAAAATEGTTATTEAPAATTEAQKTETPAAKAPEKYEFKAPEGQALAPEVMTEFSKVAKEMDLSQDQAQKLVDSVAPQMMQAQLAAFEKQKSEWTESAKSDKEFGGEKLNENLGVARKALETFGTPELTKLLNDTGLGNHPEIIRAFYKAGKQISPATFVQGGKAQTSLNSTAASKLYPDMPSS